MFEHLLDYICVALCDVDCAPGALAVLAAFLLRSPLQVDYTCIIDHHAYIQHDNLSTYKIRMTARTQQH